MILLKRKILATVTVVTAAQFGVGFLTSSLGAQSNLLTLAPPARTMAPPSPVETMAPLSTAEVIAPHPRLVVPPDYIPWWQEAALKPLRGPNSVGAQNEMGPLMIDVNALIVDALRYSARVRALSDNSLIAQTAITEADAQFDTRAFMESKFVRTSIPTGSVLEAGFDVPRLREEDWFSNGGLRKKTRFGGRLEASQRYGTRDSNSEFFFPPNQGNSRLTLSYNQPLLNGAGKAYNNSLIVLANIDTRIAAGRAATELQDHLLDITEALWRLYLQRARLVQKQRHLHRAAVILERLERRRRFDALESQIARSRAAVAMRRTELIRAGAAIRDAEARLRSLVNSPMMLCNRRLELVPLQGPAGRMMRVPLQDALTAALKNRPEIDAAAQEIEAQCVRLKMAKNELLPVLDVVLETYLSGLRGSYDIPGSWIDQFSRGEPSYTAGFVFEVPWGRRAAKAKFQRRQLQARQLSARFQQTVETIYAEVEVAVREVQTAYAEIQGKYQSMLAAEADVRFLTRRWELLPGDDRAASFLLEDLLDAQDRLAFEEFGFLQSQVEYTLSFTKLNRATGLLLQYEQIHLVRSHDGCLPTQRYMKPSMERLPPIENE